MINKKEIINVVLITFIIAFSISLIGSLIGFLYTFLAVFIVIGMNIFAKKFASFHLDSEIEIKLWEIKRFGFKTHQHLKRPFPAGAFFPIISKIFLFPLQSFVWMASLVFDVKPKIWRKSKRHGLYSFSEMTEYHLGLIAAAGIFANLILAIIGYFFNFPEFVKLNIYYAFFNMIPLSNLDGNKIFFSSLILWSFLASIVLIGLLATFFVI
jgi:hypothetical protein